jgi:dTDP-glucose pyrophosphorylase
MAEPGSNWGDILVSPDTTLHRAIEVLNSTGKMFLLIADPNLKLLGNLTDGDLRKGLLKNSDLSAPIYKFMNSKTKTVLAGTSTDKVALIFENEDVNAIPIVNKENIIQGCYFRSNFNKNYKRTSECLIMAGGFGKRMGHLTKNLPKPMLKFRGKPLLEHIIACAKKQGFNKLYLSVHYMPETIVNHFENGEKFGIEIQYLYEDKPLGTGGSVKLLPDGDEPVLIINADILTNIDFRALVEYHKLTQASATIITHQHAIHNPFGVIHANGIRVTKLEEKPVWVSNVNAGIYVVDREIRDLIKFGETIDMPDVLQRGIDKGLTVVQHQTNEKLFEIGTLEKYENILKNPKIVN